MDDSQQTDNERHRAGGGENARKGDDQRTLTKSDPWDDVEDGPSLLFAAGDLVGSRYRIVRFIASGGAAEVYEAEDEELGNRLALKALRRDPTKARAIQRFKREINLARQVTHPNVCRIYEFGNHGSDVLFLTMELLDGETLLERIQRHGRFETVEALPLVRQMAAGLQAAHKAGVIHRDFKCGNVMLVPSDDEEGGLRAVITDFGLARTVFDDPGPTVTMHDTLVGTPAYMSPEQVESAEITPRADIYAFGVVLYEMMTCQYPFQGESSLATAILRLKQPPTPPSTFVPGFDERWGKVILGCLERRPERRFATASEVVEALESDDDIEIYGFEEPDPVPAPAFRFRRWTAAAGALVVIAALLAWLDRDRPRRSIAFLGFQNVSATAGDTPWSTMLAQLMAADFDAGEDIRVIPGDNVTRARIELGFEEADLLSPAAVAEIGQHLGADLIGAGSYEVIDRGDDPELRLDVNIHRVGSASPTEAEPEPGRVIARASEQGTESKVLDLAARASRAVRRELGLKELTASEEGFARAALPVGAESMRLYSEGLEQLRLYNAREAQRLLEAAADADPGHPQIHSALSQAWEALGYGVRAREEARRAMDLSDDLSLREQRWVAARYHEIAGDRDEAIRIYTDLWNQYPDDLEYGLRLAHAQSAASEGHTALATVARLRNRAPDVVSNVRIDLAQAAAARSLTQYDLELERAGDAARKAEASGARLLLARAREMAANAYADLGEPDRAIDVFDEARDIFAAANDRGAVGRILISQSRIYRYQGRIDDALELIEEALTIARYIDDVETVRRALRNRAIILRDRGHLSEARAQNQKEYEAAHTSGEIANVQVALTNMGILIRAMGDLDGAKARFQDALDASYESGSQRGVAVNLNMIGEVLLDQGQLEEARHRFEEALEINEEITQTQRGRAFYLTNLARVDAAEGELAMARARHGEALDLRQKMDEKTTVAFSQLYLAELALAEGHSEEAVGRAQEAAEEFQREERRDDEGLARVHLARIHLHRGDLSAAGEAITLVGKLLEASENRAYRMEAKLCEAQIDAANGRGDGARVALEQLVQEAEELGYVGLRLEAALVLGRLESTRDPAAGARRLEAVAEEAERLGYRRIADAARPTA